MVEAPRAIDTLGRFCSDLTVGDVPSEVAALAGWKILDAFACAHEGAASPAVQVARRLSERLSAGLSTTLFGERMLAAPDAAFVNSAAIHSLLQDDVDLTIGHPSCNVVPAALAVGEAVDASGADVVAAIVAGYEAMWRVGGRGTWMVPTIARGFRGNTILGAIGSAAAAARVMRLDAAGTANAIAASASFAAGLLAPLNAGAMERPFQQAHNTQAGITAALLAASGLAAHTGVVEGAGGFYTTFMGEDAFPADANAGLGETWYITESFSKPYPSAGSNTVGIAVLDHLLQQGDIAGRDVAAMRVEVVQRFTGKPGYPAIANPGPFETLEHALISFPFGLACLACFGEVTLKSLSEALASPEVAELARRVELVAIDPPHQLWCRITVTDRQGGTATATSDEIEWRHFYLDERTAKEKFLAASTLPPDRSHEFVSRVLDLASAPSVRTVTAPLVDAPVPSNAGSTP